MGYAPVYDTQAIPEQPEWHLCGLNIKIGSIGVLKSANNGNPDKVGLGAMRSVWCHEDSVAFPPETKVLYDNEDMPTTEWTDLQCPQDYFV